MGNFKVGDKVRILDANGIEFGASFYDDEMETEVLHVDSDGDIYLRDKDGDEGIVIVKREFPYIEKVSDKPTKNQRISALESKVAELQAEVEALKKAHNSDAEIPSFASKLAKVIGQKAPTPTLTPNEQRKAIIAEAKAFESTVNRSTSGGVVFEIYDCKVEYVVNAEKRTVVALLRGYSSGMVRAKGIAKCAPDDVFNEHIGKAIALGRALGLDVSKFENAVKPTEFAVGQIVTFRKSSSWHREFNYRIDSITEREGNLTKLFEGGGKANADLSDNAIEELPVIDDTGAQY